MEAVGADAIVGERQAFAETLRTVGPAAGTLCGSWTAADVAAHVLSLDRLGGLPTFIGRTIVSRGFRLNDVAGRFADASIKATRRHGFDWTVEKLHSPPPRLLLRQVVAAIGLFEVFVHHEDVRRASGAAGPRAAPDGLVAVVPWLLRYHRRVLPQLSLVVRADGARFATGEGPEVVVQGSAAEVVLWLAGRTDAAEVHLMGDSTAADSLRRAPMRI